jgi:hypothetical protein
MTTIAEDMTTDTMNPWGLSDHRINRAGPVGKPIFISRAFIPTARCRAMIAAPAKNTAALSKSRVIECPPSQVRVSYKICVTSTRSKSRDAMHNLANENPLIAIGGGDGNSYGVPNFRFSHLEIVVNDYSRARAPALPGKKIIPHAQVFAETSHNSFASAPFRVSCVGVASFDLTAICPSHGRGSAP